MDININDIEYDTDSIINTATEFEMEVLIFINEWLSRKPTLTVHTSGSTGKPKEISVEKSRMRNSARMTCNYLNLINNDSALICMPMRYIAGKMMVVRALEIGMKMYAVQPSSHPLANIETIPTFAAMTPMQVFETIKTADERERLKQVKNLIIGGGSIDNELSEILKTFPNAVWSTYGMTETLSHIALRRLNGDSATEWYSAMDGVKIKKSDNNTLIISAPHICNETLTTNDIVEINSNGQFRIIGRTDNTINSGGIKIQIEDVEKTLSNYIKCDFCITSVDDAKFGQLVVLLAKQGSNMKEIESAISLLPKYWQPKHIILVDNIPTTATNKTDRARAKELAKLGI